MTLDELGKVFLFIEVCVSKSVYIIISPWKFDFLKILKLQWNLRIEIIISHYSLKITDLLMHTLTLLMCMKLTLTLVI